MGSFSKTISGYSYVKKATVKAIQYGDCKYQGEFTSPAVIRPKKSEGRLAGSFKKISQEQLDRLIRLQVQAGILIKKLPLPEFACKEEFKAFMAENWADRHLYDGLEDEYHEVFEWEMSYPEMRLYCRHIKTGWLY